MTLSQGCSEQIALEGQDLPRTYLAQHELESNIVAIIILHLSSNKFLASNIYIHQRDLCAANTAPIGNMKHNMNSNQLT